MKHATDIFGSQAFVGTARSLRWSAPAKAAGHAHHADTKPMSRNYVGTNATAIRHRPSEDST